MKQVVQEFLVESLGDTNFNRFARFLQIGLSGLREQNMDVSGVATVAELNVKDNDTVILPSNYINYIRIAVCNNGNLSELGLNGNMCLNRTADNCGDLIHTTNNNSQTISGDNFLVGGGAWEMYADNFRNGEATGRFFGLGGGGNRNGYYRIDKEMGVIQLGRTSATTIVLEYLADISKVDGKYSVHPYLVETIKAWMWWKYIQRNSSRNANEKQMAERDYYLARRQSKARFSSSTLAEWSEALRLANKQVVKF